MENTLKTTLHNDMNYIVTIDNIDYLKSFGDFKFQVKISLQRDIYKKPYFLSHYFYSLFGVLNFLQKYLNAADYSYMYKRILYTNEFIPENIRLQYLHDCL